MKYSTLITLCSILFFATACGQYDEYDQYYNEAYETGYDYNTPDAYNGQQPQGRPVAQTRGDVQMRPVMDAKTGKPAFYVPLPSSWKITQKAWVGPNQTKATYYVGKMGDPRQVGFNSMDQVINQIFQPLIQQQNARITKTYDLPEIARQKKAYFSQLWKAAPSQEKFQVKGIEVADSKGEKGLIVLAFWTSTSQYSNYAAYDYHILEAAPRDFEQAKQELIYALANVQFDRQAIANYNRKEQAKSQQSWAIHNQKMAANQANFNSWQKTQNTLSDISDIYHDTWKNTNSMNNSGHQKTINGIYNENTMVNPHTGQNVQVDYGYNQYYMNSNNEWIGTNDAFYNPQNDQNINYQDWQEMGSYYDNY